MMRIAFYVGFFPSRTQTFVLNQIVGAIDAGHQVDIYAISKDGFEGMDQRVFEYGLNKRVCYLPEAPQSFVVRLFEFLKLSFKYGPKYPDVLLKSLSWMSFGRKAFSLKLFFNLIPFLENYKQYDIIHCQFGMFGVEAVDIRKTGAIDAKLVISFRGVDTEKYLRKNPGAYDELFRQGDLFLPVCKSFAGWLVDKGCPPEKVKILYSGVDCDLFKFKPRKRNPGQPVKLLTVARLVPKKGLKHAIEASAGLLSAGYDFNYTIIGGGLLKRELKEIIRSKGLQDKVFLVGWKSRREVLQYMENSHILIASSVTAPDGDCEGIPNVIKEAMAMGMPVVSTRHSGIPELVKNGCGLLAKEGDSEDLQKCIAMLIEEESLWEEYGRNGRKIIEEHFDTRKLNRQLLELYAGLLEKQVSASKPVNCNKRAA